MFFIDRVLEEPSAVKERLLKMTLANRKMTIAPVQTIQNHHGV